MRGKRHEATTIMDSTNKEAIATLSGELTQVMQEIEIMK